MAQFQNVAVFIDRRRRYVGVNVEIDDQNVARIFHRRNGLELNSFQVVEQVKAGEAWDVMAGGKLSRMVCQTGCGCGGMRKYVPDPGYSGALRA